MPFVEHIFSSYFQFLASAGLNSIIGHVEQEALKLRVAIGLELLLTLKFSSQLL